MSFTCLYDADLSVLSMLVLIKGQHRLYVKVCVCHTWSVFNTNSVSPCSCLSRFTQMDCDGHLAQCLSEVNVDMTW